MFFWFIAIFIISLILAFRSMKDFDVPVEIKKMVSSRKMKGTIIPTKKKLIHYSSDSSAFSSGSKGK